MLSRGKSKKIQNLWFQSMHLNFESIWALCDKMIEEKGGLQRHNQRNFIVSSLGAIWTFKAGVLDSRQVEAQTVSSDIDKHL